MGSVSFSVRSDHIRKSHFDTVEVEYTHNLLEFGGYKNLNPEEPITLKGHLLRLSVPEYRRQDVRFVGYYRLYFKRADGIWSHCWFDEHSAVKESRMVLFEKKNKLHKLLYQESDFINE